MDSKKKGLVPTPDLRKDIEQNKLAQQHPTKGNHFLTQQKEVFKAFFGTPKTMLEVEAETGVMRSNITWYVDEWLKTKSIQRVETGVCSITKHRAGRYSTNPMFWEKGGEDAEK